MTNIIKIQNRKQLDQILSLSMSNDVFKRMVVGQEKDNQLFDNTEFEQKAFKETQIAFTFDMFEIAYEQKLVLSQDFNSKEAKHDFYDVKTNQLVFSYNILNKTITEYDNLESTVISLCETDDVVERTDEDLISTDKAFLIMAGFDISDGYHIQDTIRTRKIRQELSIAFYGERYVSN